MQPLTNDPNIQIDSAHCGAICDEVGYRLRQTLKESVTEHPPHLKLLELLSQTHDDRQNLDGAPSIVPSLRKPTA